MLERPSTSSDDIIQGKFIIIFVATKAQHGIFKWILMQLSSQKLYQEIFYKTKIFCFINLSKTKRNRSEFRRGWWSPWANFERFRPQEFRKSTTSGDIWGHSVCSDQVANCNSRNWEYAKSVYFLRTGLDFIRGSGPRLLLNLCFSSVFRRNQPAVFPAQDDSRIVDGLLRHGVCQLCIVRKREQEKYRMSFFQGEFWG